MRSVYALVRVADEVVDGAAEATGLPAAHQRLLLDEPEAETLAAVARGFSTNSSFTRSLAARECGIGHDLIRLLRLHAHRPHAHAA
jgi:phytoene/squalene synthetase